MKIQIEIYPYCQGIRRIRIGIPKVFRGISLLFVKEFLNIDWNTSRIPIFG
jgi:hypothetical protein